MTSKDVVAEAVTGSGKTIAFAVAAVELCARVATRGAPVVVCVGARAATAVPSRCVARSWRRIAATPRGATWIFRG